MELLVYNRSAYAGLLGLSHLFIVALAEKLQPDVILMELQMPGGDVLSAFRQIVQISPHIRILVVIMFEDDDSVFAAMQAGACGYVLKEMNDAEITRAILAVGNGEAIAQQLGLSIKTVRNYVSNVFSKLQLADRAQVVVKAREAGLY